LCNKEAVFSVQKREASMKTSRELAKGAKKGFETLILEGKKKIVLSIVSSIYLLVGLLKFQVYALVG